MPSTRPNAHAPHPRMKPSIRLIRSSNKSIVPLPRHREHSSLTVSVYERPPPPPMSSFTSLSNDILPTLYNLDKGSLASLSPCFVPLRHQRNGRNGVNSHFRPCGAEM